MSDHTRAFWGSAATRLVNGAFPEEPDDPSQWPICARLVPHVVPLDAFAPRTGDAGKALDRLLNQASLYLAQRGDPEGALAMAEKSVALRRVTRADEPLELATSLNNLGRRDADLNRLDEAEAAYLETLAIKEPLLAANDPSLAITLSNLAGVYWKRKAFAAAEPLLLRAAEIMKAGQGAESAQYGTLLSNLGALYGDWADKPGEAGRRAQEEEYKTKEFAICIAARGPRHPETAISHSNLAVMRAKRSHWRDAADESERAVAIMLSLDLEQHPNTKRRAIVLAQFWKQSNQAAKAARLRNGDISDLLPVIAKIEAEHRAWVAEDPENRHFGPPAFFEPKSEDHAKQLLSAFAEAGGDVDGLVSRMESEELSPDDFARIVVERIARKAE